MLRRLTAQIALMHRCEGGLDMAPDLVHVE
jgi:hypothetical protein